MSRFCRFFPLVLSGALALAAAITGCPSKPGDARLLRFGGYGDDLFYAAARTSDGGLVLAGLTEADHEEDNNAWLVKLDARGQKTWQAAYGGRRDDQARSVAPVAIGGYVLTGQLAVDAVRPLAAAKFI